MHLGLYDKERAREEAKEIRSGGFESWVVAVLNGMLEAVSYTIPYLQVAWLSNLVRDLA